MGQETKIEQRDVGSKTTYGIPIICPENNVPVGRLGQFLTADKLYDNMLSVGDRSVGQERRRLRDRLSDDQNLFKGLLGKCNN